MMLQLPAQGLVLGSVVLYQPLAEGQLGLQYRLSLQQAVIVVCQGGHFAGQVIEGCLQLTAAGHPRSDLLLQLMAPQLQVPELFLQFFVLILNHFLFVLELVQAAGVFGLEGRDVVRVQLVAAPGLVPQPVQGGFLLGLLLLQLGYQFGFLNQQRV
jgi:hypothetical protein